MNRPLWGLRTDWECTRCNSFNTVYRNYSLTKYSNLILEDFFMACKLCKYQNGLWRTKGPHPWSIGFGGESVDFQKRTFLVGDYVWIEYLWVFFSNICFLNGHDEHFAWFSISSSICYYRTRPKEHCFYVVIFTIFALLLSRFTSYPVFVLFLRQCWSGGWPFTMLPSDKVIIHQGN